MNVTVFLSELREESIRQIIYMIGLGLNGSLIRCSEESESGRRMSLLLGEGGGEL